MTFARSALLLALLAVTGCARHSPAVMSLVPTHQPTADEMRMAMIDERKDELLRQLAVRESGAHGD